MQAAPLPPRPVYSSLLIITLLLPVATVRAQKSEEDLGGFTAPDG